MGVDDEKLRRVIMGALELAPEQYTPDLAFGRIASWDSLGHVNLIFAIEDGFGVKFRSTEIPQLKTVQKIQEALESRLTAPPDTR